MFFCGTWVYFLYPGTPRVLRSELAPFAYLEDRSPELYLPKPSFLLFVGMVHKQKIKEDERGVGKSWRRAGETEERKGVEETLRRQKVAT